ncbi:MAG: hypothetical protein JKY17_06620 [Magnetovibrio sp.]|nr:hypothetical protein [Magnetovibrio sp.]
MNDYPAYPIFKRIYPKFSRWDRLCGWVSVTKCIKGMVYISTGFLLGMSAIIFYVGASA